MTDSSGAALVGATVTIHNVDTGIDRITQTNVDGSYLVPELQIGSYNVTVNERIFQKAVTKGVVVDVASQKRIDAMLKPGQVNTANRSTAKICRRWIPRTTRWVAAHSETVKDCR